MQEFSKSKINDLGKRLRNTDDTTPEDIALLNAYRNSFAAAFQVVNKTLVEAGAAPTERSKSTLSIVQKLRREKTLSLSTMQDIAGCRVIVKNIAQQDQFVAALITKFEDVKVVDRREKPSHAYRAVHVIPKVDGMPVEIQVRTQLQHMWAQLSERVSDVVGEEIKYGGGHIWWINRLEWLSDQIKGEEKMEWFHADNLLEIERLSILNADGTITLDDVERLRESKKAELLFQNFLPDFRDQIIRHLDSTSEALHKQKGEL